MLETGYTATRAALEVGYESPSQFTREYGRLFRQSPKRDVMQVREASREMLRAGGQSRSVPTSAGS